MKRYAAIALALLLVPFWAGGHTITGGPQVDCDLETQTVLFDVDTGAWSCGADAGAAGTGDNISVNGSAAGDANFIDGDIDWTLNTVPAPDEITATVGCTDCVTLTTETTGNYVTSVATTAPITGGAAGSEGATLTLALTQNAGTDVTADLEEEAHCAEHDSADVNCSGETIVLADNSVGIAELTPDPAADDQALISDSSAAATWRTLTDSNGAFQALQYDTATNAFSTATVTDVTLPVESGDGLGLHDGAYFDISGTEFASNPQLSTYTSVDSPAAGVVIACSGAFPCTGAAGESATVRITGMVTGVDTTTMSPGGYEGWPVCVTGLAGGVALSVINCEGANGTKRVVAWIETEGAGTGVLRVAPQAAGRNRTVVVAGSSNCNAITTNANDGAFVFGDICFTGTDNAVWFCEGGECYLTGWQRATATPTDNSVNDLQLLTSGSSTAGNVLVHGAAADGIRWQAPLISFLFPAGACQNAVPVASTHWSWDATFPAISCHTNALGNGTTKGVFDFINAANAAVQTTFNMPNLWRTGSTITVQYLWFGATGSTNTVGWCTQIACTTNNAAVDDPAFPALAATNCVADAGDATANEVNLATDIITPSGCEMDRSAHVRISRDGNGTVVTDSYTDTARLIAVELQMNIDFN